MGRRHRSETSLVVKILVAIVLSWAVWVLRDGPWWYVGLLCLIPIYFVANAVREYRRERRDVGNSPP